MYTKLTKVDESHSSVAREENVLSLDISVEDMCLVQVAEPLQNLPHDVGDEVFRKILRLGPHVLDQVRDRPSTAVLQAQREIVGIFLSVFSVTQIYIRASNFTDLSVFLQKSGAHYGQKSKNTEENSAPGGVASITTNGKHACNTDMLHNYGKLADCIRLTLKFSWRHSIHRPLKLHFTTPEPRNSDSNAQ